MLSWIDQLARIIGYGAIITGIIWVLGKWAEDRSVSRTAQIERESLERMRLERPEAYEQEMWWRDNDRRFRAGLPTDPKYIERMKAIVQNCREDGLL
ncbi:hypothetical protein [Sphingomonas sp. G-3-2-10]|uniref:hypothetical protein n=1 Tax=Sphingomonas sp. G-3-2-10 TaxID=2728838 RepID=UPI00146B0F7C|nr:hypothetical protein [Sphingomonas sp. G-3-2-10]NML06534.1 hypothetical protein [Sphingomonas sp. G-3-2-10]